MRPSRTMTPALAQFYSSASGTGSRNARCWSMTQERRAKALWVLVWVPILLGAVSGRAETKSKNEAWTFEVAPNVWIPKIEGHVTARGRFAGVRDEFFYTAAFSEGGLVGGSGHFEARKRRLTLFLNAAGTTADTAGSLGKALIGELHRAIHTDLALVEFGAAYRVAERRFAARAPRAFWIDALVGGRYVHLANDLQFDHPESGGPIHFEGRADADVADPIIGGRWSLELLDNLAWLFSGDVGGFGAGTKRSWQILSTLRYRLPWAPLSRPIWASAGYHLIDLDERGEETRHGQTRINLQFRGPIVGLAMEF
jgi:hypothetical protein